VPVQAPSTEANKSIWKEWKRRMRVKKKKIFYLRWHNWTHSHNVPYVMLL